MDPSLEWLIAPSTKADFFDQYWEKRPLVIKRGQPEYFRSLLSFEDIDRVITTLDRRYPDICLKNANDSRVTSSEYTLAGGALDVARLYQLFESGSTIALAFLDSVLPKLNRFCRSLEAEFNFPLQTNIYMTPPAAQGAKPHYDTHDVFVLQVAGSKHWRIFGTPVESPLQTQEFNAQEHALGEITQEFQLDPGDLAYVPRGVGHEAQSTDTVSLHITTGILRYTWADLLLDMISGGALNNPALRKALPPGFARNRLDRTRLHEKVDELIRIATAPENIDAALNRFVERFVAGSPPVLEGQLAQMAQLDSLHADSRIRVRPSVFWRIEKTAESVAIDTYGRRITFPAHAADAVEFVLSQNDSFVVKDVPDDLDDAGKLTLIRRLIREGLVQAELDADKTYA